MKVALITGNPGAGKSSLAAELADHGHAAIEADDLAGWETLAGEPVAQPAPMPEDWALSHRWVWSRSRIERLIDERASGGQDLFVCGIATNQRDMLDLFDLVFLLTLDHRTQIERLNAASNIGRPAAERTQIIEGRTVFEAQMRAAGAILLDGRRPTRLLAADILGAVTSADMNRAVPERLSSSSTDRDPVS